MLLNQHGQPLAQERRPRPRADYAAAQFNRFTNHLPSVCQLTVDELRGGALSVLMARSRHIYKNHAHAHGAINFIGRRVAAGLKVQARLRGADGRYMREENKALEGLFEDWSRRGVTVRRQKARALWKLAFLHRVLDGEVFLVKTESSRAWPVTRRWQVVRGDQLADNYAGAFPGVASGNTVVMGIEETPEGDPAAYHFYDDGQSAYCGGTGRTLRRVTADRVIHWFSPVFADQRRGIPLLTPVILKMADMDEYIMATLTQAWGQAAVVAFIKTGMPAERQESMVGAEIDEDYAPQRWREDIVPGVKEYLLPGEDVTYADPKAPGGNFDPFTKAILRAIACGIGISYEALARDYSQVNYSSIRQGQLDDKMTFREFSDEMDEEIVGPVWRDFIDHVYLLNRVRPMPAAQDVYASWIQHPQPGWVDPLKEQLAWAQAIENKIATRHEACAERNRDFYEVVDELAEEEAYMRESGLAATPEAVKVADRQMVAKIFEIESREKEAAGE